MQNIVFFNVGYMKRYQGKASDDKITGGGSYPVENETGGEIYNFMPFDGYCYGFVETMGRKKNGERIPNQIHIEKINESAIHADRVDNVIVVWVATRPNVGSVIVGWYKAASVYNSPVCLDQYLV